MISGAHIIIYSTNPEADRAFFKDVLEFPNVDVGGGWLIFALPPSEAAVHPADANGCHELYLMCDDVKRLTDTLITKNIACSPVHEEPWGSFIEATLPGGGKLGIYQPKHARPAH
jgi:hypothetical protein